MKNVFIVTVTAATFILAACNHFETSGNGDLDGFWHLQRIDTLMTGGTLDLSEQYFFWAVEHKLLVTENSKDVGNRYIFRFLHQGDSLTLYDPYKYNREEEGDISVDDVTALAPFGVNNLVEAFYVEYMTSTRMILKSETLRIRFKKM